jgi:hypothetical protein
MDGTGIGAAVEARLRLVQVRRITARGRMLAAACDGSQVIADIQSGAGSGIGDLLEGDTRPGARVWRNPGNGMCVPVRVLAEVEPADAHTCLAA